MCRHITASGRKCKISPDLEVCHIHSKSESKGKGKSESKSKGKSEGKGKEREAVKATKPVVRPSKVKKDGPPIEVICHEPYTDLCDSIRADALGLTADEMAFTVSAGGVATPKTGGTAQTEPGAKLPSKASTVRIVERKVQFLNDTCPICLDPIKPDRHTQVLECRHLIHTNCCDGLEKLECPMCRAPMKRLPKDLADKIRANGRTYAEERVMSNSESFYALNASLRVVCNLKAKGLTVAERRRSYLRSLHRCHLFRRTYSHSTFGGETLRLPHS
jgi:hypothetical protein